MERYTRFQMYIKVKWVGGDIHALKWNKLKILKSNFQYIDIVSFRQVYSKLISDLFDQSFWQFILPEGGLCSQFLISIRNQNWRSKKLWKSNCGRKTYNDKMIKSKKSSDLLDFVLNVTLNLPNNEPPKPPQVKKG